MSFVLHGATILTADEGRRVIPRGAIAVDDDRIADVGPAGEVLERYPEAERIDASGRAIMPGLANCHTHFTLTLSRGIQEDFSFPSTLRFPRGVASYLEPGERQVFARLGALEAIRSGTTAAFEIGGGLDEYAGALAECGIRVVLGETAADLDQAKAARDGVFEFDPGRGEAGLARIEALHRDWHGAGEGRITVAVAAHAPEAVSPGLLRSLRELAERLDTVATIHLNQSWWEVESVMRTRGVLPTEYLFQNEFLWEHLIGGHCRCMDTREIQLLGRSRAFVSFNSAIAARRGYSPCIADLAAAGCTIAMGSDNMAEDMIEVMRTGLFMERVRTGDGERPTPEDVIQWATANGHRALGWNDSGVLAAGRKADFIVIDTRKPHLVPSMRITSAFVHQGQPADVEGVVVDGRWVMRDGAVLTMDEPSVIADAERIARRAWRRLLEDYPDVPFPLNLDVEEPG